MSHTVAGPQVAIVGIGGVFPCPPADSAAQHGEGDSLARFWSIVSNGLDTAREVPEGRWVLPPEQAYEPSKGRPDRVYSQRGCFIRPQDIAAAEWNRALGLTDQRLARFDVAVQLALRAAHDAWRDAVTRNLDRARVGVVLANLVLPNESVSRLAGWILGRRFERELFARAGRAAPPQCPPGVEIKRVEEPASVVARALGLAGTHTSIDAACSSSLYALKQAVDELQSGRADAMLAGGVSRPDALFTQMGFSQLRALSARGRCAPFDQSADGIVVGEGAGVLLLKRLDTAIAAGDRIYAVVRGIGLSNDVDGDLLAPSAEGQLRAMRAALARANWQPEDVDLIECHATGTPVGDRVEMSSLRALWQGRSARRGQCVVGSVKSNVGHLLTGAGAAGLIKTLLALQHQALPPTANFERADDDLAYDEGPFRVATGLEPWPRRRPDCARRAAVSGFGFGGTNAHVLLEEHLPAARGQVAVPRSIVAEDLPPPDVGCDVALVGLDVRVGPWLDLDSFARRIFASEAVPVAGPTAREGFWGLTDPPRGFFIEQLEIPLGRFRIPPKEIEASLPQQMLMLDVARRALADARIGRPTGSAAGATAEGLRTGVFIGLSLDFNTTNYYLRWLVRARAPRWAEALGLRLDAPGLARWIDTLCDQIGPALDANRTIGGIGSIVASRIARELGFGGSSYVFCSDESSGLAALDAALHALRAHDVDRALVGAVDLTGDARGLLADDLLRPFSRSGSTKPFDRDADGGVPADAAVALVLERDVDAARAGRRSYARVGGLGSATCATVQASYLEALRLAHQRGGHDPATVSYVEAHGDGQPAHDRAEAAALTQFYTRDAADPLVVGCTKDRVGHSGAASGLIALAKAALCLHHKTLTPLLDLQRPLPSARKLRFLSQPQPWVYDSSTGEPLAGVSSIARTGQCTHVILQGARDERIEPRVDRLPPTVPPAREALFLARGETIQALAAHLRALARHGASMSERPLDAIARSWWRNLASESARRTTETPPAQSTSCAPTRVQQMALVVRSSQELVLLAQQAANQLEDGVNPTVAGQTDRVLFSNEPLASGGQIAFVFPGSGTQHPGMGRELALHFPSLLETQQRHVARLRSQLMPQLIWQPDYTAGDPRSAILALVSLGTLLSDLVRSFGIEADAAIGYSLGESTSLFALGAWQQRDEMLNRVLGSDLFSTQLAGPCDAARRSWKVPPGEPIQWLAGVLDQPASRVEQALIGRERVYLLIVNTPDECVIGGDQPAIERLVADLGCRFVPLPGVATVHCPIAASVSDDYRRLHLLDTRAPERIRFYSAARGGPYVVTRESAAETITAQANRTVDFAALIERAWHDGVRLFVEIGPGRSCTRMISRILRDRPHRARSACAGGPTELGSLLRLLGLLWAEGIEVDLCPLYGTAEIPNTAAKTPTAGPQLNLRTGHPGFTLDSVLPTAPSSTPPSQRHTPAAALAPTVADGILSLVVASARAHADYLQLAARSQDLVGRQAAWQLQLAQQIQATPQLAAAPALAAPHQQNLALGALTAPTVADHPSAAPDNAAPTRLDRRGCLEFARGSIANVFGSAFAAVDAHPTRVRLPDEPLMLVDRVLQITGQAGSLGAGTIVTEHDVLEGAWYLDRGRIPTSVAVEAGQADLMLSAYLGIDFATRGEAVYRLLDATVEFYDDLPAPGQTVRYEIAIERFARQDDVWLFWFHFDAFSYDRTRSDGPAQQPPSRSTPETRRPLMSMRNGCAGFFSPTRLAAGEGLVSGRLALTNPARAAQLPHGLPLVPMRSESLDRAQVDALRGGDLAAAFGGPFADLPPCATPLLPSGRMRLVDRVLQIEPEGGTYGLGRIRAEADVAQDAWFLRCHFVDDQVMPGTLMYECCLHTLRILLLRMGWVPTSSAVRYQPIVGKRSRLKCRGQVLAETRVVGYDVSLKELGYAPEAYAVADATMLADGKPIVEIRDLSLRLSGTQRADLESFWQAPATCAVASTPPPLSDRRPASTSGPKAKPARYTRAQIEAFARGKPSEAFGAPYLPFDAERTIARLPSPPFLFIDRITEVEGAPFEMVAGASCEAQVAIAPSDWYFASNRQHGMPFAVLLEIVLQPCGWLAAYVGSALTSPTDLRFRNLGGEACAHGDLVAEHDMLTTRASLTRVSSSGGMIIQHYTFELTSAQRGPIYDGTTYFGFFSQDALSNQLGISGARPHEAQADLFEPSVLPEQAPFPDHRLRMVDRIELYLPTGGPHGLGFIRGSINVDPSAWFFAAHFYQDPVWPGSLGLEGLLQLLKFVACDRLGPARQFSPIARGVQHQWSYRGQVVPRNQCVVIEACVTALDPSAGRIVADGLLLVDGRPIYQMKNFALERLS